MDLEKYINNIRDDNDNKDAKNLFLAGVLTSAYTSLLMIKPIRKWVNDSKSKQQFSNKVNSLNKRIVIPSSILDLPKKFNIPNLINMVTGSSKETDYSRLLRTLTTGSNTESYNIVKSKKNIVENINRTLKKIDDFNTKLSNGTSLNLLGGLDFLENKYISERKNRISLYKDIRKLEDLSNQYSEFNKDIKYDIRIIKDLEKKLLFYKKPLDILENYNKLLSIQRSHVDKLYNNKLFHYRLTKKDYKKIQKLGFTTKLFNEIFYPFMKGRSTIVWNVFNTPEVRNNFTDPIIEKNNREILNPKVFGKYPSARIASKIKNILYDSQNTQSVLYNTITNLENNIEILNEYKNYAKIKLNNIKNEQYSVLKDYHFIRAILMRDSNEYLSARYQNAKKENIQQLTALKSLYNNIFKNQNIISQINNIAHYEDDFKKITSKYITRGLNQYKDLNTSTNIDELRNARNNLKFNTQLLYVFNNVLRHLRNKSVNYIQNIGEKGYRSYKDILRFDVTDRLRVLHDYIEKNNIRQYLNQDGSVKKLLQVIDIKEDPHYSVSKPRLFVFTKTNNKNYTNEDMFKYLQKHIQNYIKDSSTGQVLLEQINSHKKRLMDRGNFKENNPIIQHLFRGYTQEAQDKNLNFVKNLVELTLQQDNVKKVSVVTKNISNSLIVDFNIITNENIALNVNIPVPNFSGLTRTGLSSPFVVNQYEFMTEFTSMYQGWLESYVGKINQDWMPAGSSSEQAKQAKQEVYQKTQKMIKKYTTQLNAFGISSENPIQDLINGTTVKGDLSAIIEHFDSETRRKLESNFNLIKRLHGKDSKYKKVFIDLEFDSGINPLNKNGQINDISELAMMTFGYDDQLKSTVNLANNKYHKGLFQKRTQYKLPKGNYKIVENQYALVKEFLSNFNLSDIENTIIVSKASTMSGGDLDRLLGMLSDYMASDQVTDNEKELIRKLRPRLAQSINYINFQDFMMYSDLSVSHRIDVGSKKGEVLEKEIYEMYFRARQLGDLGKAKYIEKITEQLNPELNKRIRTTYKKKSQFIPHKYTHHAADDVKTMAIYSYIVGYNINQYNSFEDYRKGKEFRLKDLNVIWSQNLANSQNIWKGNLNVFDLRTMLGQNELHIRNKLRHYFNAETFTISSAADKYIKVSDDVITDRQMRILSESLNNFVYERNGKIHKFKEHLYGANVFNALQPTPGLWEGSIMYNVNTIGQTYIQNKRRETVVVKLRKKGENLTYKVGEVIQPNAKMEIEDVEASFLGEKPTGEKYINFTNRPKRIVSITSDEIGEYAIVELEEVVRMSSGQKVTINGSSGLLNEGVNSVYDLMIHSKNFTTGNKKAIVDQMLGRAVELIDSNIRYPLQIQGQNELLRQQLLKIGIIKEVNFSKSNGLINIITYDLDKSLINNHKQLDQAIIQIGKFLKDNFSIMHHISKSNTMKVNISSTQKKLQFTNMDIKEWGSRIANDVFKMTLDGDLDTETVIKNVLLGITDEKYHKQIENLFGVQNYYNYKSNIPSNERPKKPLKNGEFKLKKKAADERLELLKTIFSDTSTGYLFSLMGLESNGVKSFITGVSGLNAAGLIYDEMQGSHNTKSLIIGPLFNILAKMNAVSKETLDVYKYHIEKGVDPRLAFNIRNVFNTEKSFQEDIQKMVNLNKLFKTNKDFTNLIETVLNDSIFHDNSITDMSGTIIGYASQDSKVVKNLDKNQLETLRFLYNAVENSDETQQAKRGAYYEKNGKKYWITADELLIRNTENPNEYLISRQFYNLIKLHNNKNYRVENAISDEFDMISRLRANELTKGVVPGQNIAITSGKEITINQYDFYMNKFKNVTKTMNYFVNKFELGRSLFFGEQILQIQSVHDIPGFDKYVKEMKLNDMKRDILYLIDYDKYKESIEKFDNKHYGIDFLQQYQHKQDIARLNNLRWEAIYEAERTGKGVYAEAVKKFNEKHKRKFSEFILEVLNTATPKHIDKLKNEMKTAIELEMISIRQNNVKNPAGSSSVYENNRVFVHVDEAIDRPMLVSSNIVVALSKKDFDGDTINAMIALSANPKSTDVYKYFDRDYLRSRKRIDILKRNGLLKDNDLGLSVIEDSRVFSFDKNFNMEASNLTINTYDVDVVKDKIIKKQSNTKEKNNTNNAMVKYTRKYAAEAYKRGFIGQLTLTKIKYGIDKNNLLDSVSVQELFDSMIAPIVESPLAMNKYATDVPTAFMMLNKAQTKAGRKDLRRYLESDDALTRANFKTFDKFLNNRFKIITTKGYVNGKLRGDIYNKGAVELMKVNVGASFDEKGYAFLKEGDKFYNELSNFDVINEIKTYEGKTIKGNFKYITSLDFTRGILPILAKEQGINQSIERQYNMILGHSSAQAVADYFEKFGINPFDVNNSSLIHAIRQENQSDGFLSKISESSQKFIKKNKKVGMTILGGALIASYIAGNTLGQTPGEYISNSLLDSQHIDESQYSDLMNQAIYSPNIQSKLHLMTPMYQKRFDYAGYSSQLIQSQNVNPIQTQSVRTMPLIFN